MARARPCTQSVHGRGRPYTWAANTAVYRVHDGVHGHVPVHSRVYGPCTGPPMYRVHDQGRVQTVYTIVHGPCIWSVHDAYTAVYGCAPCTRSCLRKGYTAVHGRVPRVRSVNTAADRVHGCSRPCTWPCSDHVRPCTGSVHGVNSRVHGP